MNFTNEEYQTNDLKISSKQHILPLVAAYNRKHGTKYQYVSEYAHKRYMEFSSTKEIGESINVHPTTIVVILRRLGATIRRAGRYSGYYKLCTNDKFYGFKNQKTGLFKRNYNTSTIKKTCCFKIKENAEQALKLNNLQDTYVVDIITETEKDQ